MVQLCIYDYLGLESDPIYQTIYMLKKGQESSVSNIKILFNQYGLYEVSTDVIHEGFTCPEDCYERLQELIQ